MTRARILPSGARRRLQFRQPAQGRLTIIATHFQRRLQATTTSRSPRLAKQSTAQVGQQMRTRRPRWLVQRRDRGSNAASTATRATGKGQGRMQHRHPRIVAGPGGQRTRRAQNAPSGSMNTSPLRQKRAQNSPLKSMICTNLVHQKNFFEQSSNHPHTPL